MLTDRRIEASVLPMVIVISALMLLVVLALLGYSEMSTLITERAVFNKNCRADIESAFVWYENDPDVRGEVQLYDSIPASVVTISRKNWGLYEVVSVAHSAGRIEQTNLMGLRVKPRSEVFFYADSNNPLTITGNTNLLGRISVPSASVVYGQSGATFFSGKTIYQNQITASDKELPAPYPSLLKSVNTLLATDYSNAQNIQNGDSLGNSFYDKETLIVAYNGTLRGELRGNIILGGDEITLHSSAKLADIVVIGRKVIVGENFRGRVQVFASDTLIVEKNAELEYPSGIYSACYAELQDGSIVNGYVIVNAEANSDITKPNYRQSRLAKVRGLLYIEGNALLQGIVSGTAYIKRATYYSKQGYWKDMLLDATILENEEMALPLWFGTSDKRQRMVWLD